MLCILIAPILRVAMSSVSLLSIYSAATALSKWLTREECLRVTSTWFRILEASCGIRTQGWRYTLQPRCLPWGGSLSTTSWKQYAKTRGAFTGSNLKRHHIMDSVFCCYTWETSAQLTCNKGSCDGQLWHEAHSSSLFFNVFDPVTPFSQIWDKYLVNRALNVCLRLISQC